MNDSDDYACNECDLLITVPDFIASGKKVVCPRCQHTITTGLDNSLDKVIALSFTAIIVLIISGYFPFLSFSSQGQQRTISLFQASSELYSQGFPGLALLVFFFIYVMPFLYLLLLLIVLSPIKFGIPRSPPILLGKIISRLLPWAMSEVFVIGVLVALIKIVTMADIVLGISFWSYFLFAPLFTYIVSIVDTHRLWNWIEHGY